MYLLYTNAVLLVILILASTDLPKKLFSRLFVKIGEDRAAAVAMKGVYVAVLFLISTAYLVDASYNPFLYFRF